MSEDDKTYQILAELPGLAAKDFDLSISGNTLVLKGKKLQEKEEKDKIYYFSERAYGTFQRAFELRRASTATKSPPIFSKGVLTITLPKTPEVQKQQRKSRSNRPEIVAGSGGSFLPRAAAYSPSDPRQECRQVARPVIVWASMPRTPGMLSAATRSAPALLLRSDNIPEIHDTVCSHDVALGGVPIFACTTRPSVGRGACDHHIHWPVDLLSSPVREAGRHG
jgi:hypothetical protein